MDISEKQVKAIAEKYEVFENEMMFQLLNEVQSVIHAWCNGALRFQLGPEHVHAALNAVVAQHQNQRGGPDSEKYEKYLTELHSGEILPYDIDKSRHYEDQIYNFFDEVFNAQIEEHNSFTKFVADLDLGVNPDDDGPVH